MKRCDCPHTLTCEDLNLTCEQQPGDEHWPVLSKEQWEGMGTQ